MTVLFLTIGAKKLTYIFGETGQFYRGTFTIRSANWLEVQNTTDSRSVTAVSAHTLPDYPRLPA